MFIMAFSVENTILVDGTNESCSKLKVLTNPPPLPSSQFFLFFNKLETDNNNENKVQTTPSDLLLPFL